MRGEFASVRLPRRMVPIWVSDPIGLASPLRIGSTPAIVVVLTAPRPTSMIPSFPSAVWMVFGCFTIGRSYSSREHVDIWNVETGESGNLKGMGIFRRSQTEPLAVTMAGVKLGDRFLSIGVRDATLVAALAAKSGLTGRACAVDADPALAAAGAGAVKAEGALIDVVQAPWDALPYQDASFDVALARSVLSTLAP